MLYMIASIFIVPRWKGPSGNGGGSGDERLAEDMVLQELGPSACCICDHRLFTTGVLSGVDNSCIGATGLWFAASPQHLSLSSIRRMGCSSTNKQLGCSTWLAGSLESNSLY